MSSIAASLFQLARCFQPACLSSEGEGRDREGSLCCGKHVCAGLGLMHVEIHFATALFWGEREVGKAIFLYTAITCSEAVKQKELSTKDFNEESTVTLRMTRKCSCSEQCQFPILFVAGNILEGSLRQNAFPITNQLPAFWMVSSSGSKCSKSVVSVLV